MASLFSSSFPRGASTESDEKAVKLHYFPPGDNDRAISIREVRDYRLGKEPRPSLVTYILKKNKSESHERGGSVLEALPILHHWD